MTPTEIRDAARTNVWPLRDPVEHGTGTPSGDWLVDRLDGTGVRYQWDGEAFDDGTTVDLSEVHAQRLAAEADADRQTAIKAAHDRMAAIHAALDGGTPQAQALADVAKVCQHLIRDLYR